MDSIIKLLEKDTTEISTQEKATLVKEYCLEHNKDVQLTNIFVGVLVNFSMLDVIFDYIIEKYKKDNNIVTITNSDNQILKILKNE